MSETQTRILDYRSPSQASLYDKCGYAYYLRYIKKAYKRPAAWTVQGTAFHEAVERFERSNRVMTLDEIREAFSDAYSREINHYAETTPNLAFWFGSGPYRGAVDIDRRYGIGLDQIEGFYNWALDNPFSKPWVSPDDSPIIEYQFEVKFGDVKVRGVIDTAVNATPRDYKTGKKPGEDVQLATYSGVFNVLWDIPFTTADYWMATKSSPTKPYDMSGWSVQRLADYYGDVDDKIRSEEFEPSPEQSKCMFCDVRDSCEFRIG